MVAVPGHRSFGRPQRLLLMFYTPRGGAEALAGGAGGGNSLMRVRRVRSATRHQQVSQAACIVSDGVLISKTTPVNPISQPVHEELVY